MSENLLKTAQALRELVQDATFGMVGRAQMAELMLLASVASEHLLVIGPPGTAKSAVVRRVAQALGGRYFEYLLGRFTEPSELFGPVDLSKLRQGVVETDVTGMLPEADIAFLDEVFLGSTAILNTLLGLLNERRFRRGHTNLQVPLKLCVGASNQLPDDEALAAFADRFLLHLFIESVPDHQLEELLTGGWQIELTDAQAKHSLDALVQLRNSVRQVDVAPVRATLANAVRALRAAGVQLSDRRIVKAQKLIAAAALLRASLQATEVDLWPIFYVLPTVREQVLAREVLANQLAVAQNPCLQAAVEWAARKPVSRTARLIEAAQHALQSEDANPAAVLREIDANFSSDDLPDALRDLRQALMQTHAERNASEQAPVTPDA
jgi:MoxR-like ATPase